MSFAFSQPENLNGILDDLPESEILRVNISNAELSICQKKDGDKITIQMNIVYIQTAAQGTIKDIPKIAQEDIKKILKITPSTPLKKKVIPAKDKCPGIPDVKNCPFKKLVELKTCGICAALINTPKVKKSSVIIESKCEFYMTRQKHYCGRPCNDNTYCAKHLAAKQVEIKINDEWVKNIDSINDKFDEESETPSKRTLQIRAKIDKLQNDEKTRIAKISASRAILPPVQEEVLKVTPQIVQTKIEDTDSDCDSAAQVTLPVTQCKSKNSDCCNIAPRETEIVQNETEDSGDDIIQFTPAPVQPEDKNSDCDDIVKSTLQETEIVQEETEETEDTEETEETEETEDTEETDDDIVKSTSRETEIVQEETEESDDDIVVTLVPIQDEIEDSESESEPDCDDPVKKKLYTDISACGRELHKLYRPKTETNAMSSEDFTKYDDKICAMQRKLSCLKDELENYGSDSKELPRLSREYIIFPDEIYSEGKYQNLECKTDGCINERDNILNEYCSSTCKSKEKTLEQKKQLKWSVYNWDIICASKDCLNENDDTLNQLCNRLDCERNKNYKPVIIDKKYKPHTKYETYKNIYMGLPCDTPNCKGTTGYRRQFCNHPDCKKMEAKDFQQKFVLGKLNKKYENFGWHLLCGANKSLSGHACGGMCDAGREYCNKPSCAERERIATKMQG